MTSLSEGSELTPLYKKQILVLISCGFLLPLPLCLWRVAAGFLPSHKLLSSASFWLSFLWNVFSFPTQRRDITRYWRFQGIFSSFTSSSLLHFEFELNHWNFKTIIGFLRSSIWFVFAHIQFSLIGVESFYPLAPLSWHPWNSLVGLMIVIADRCSYGKGIPAGGVCVLGTAAGNKWSAECSYCEACGALWLKCAHLWLT